MSASNRSPAEKRLAAQQATKVGWARTRNRTARTQPGRDAWRAKLEVDLPKLSEPEREQLKTLFAALVRAREQAQLEAAPKLWTLTEYRDSGREETA